MGRTARIDLEARAREYKQHGLSTLNVFDRAIHAECAALFTQGVSNYPTHMLSGTPLRVATRRGTK